MVIEKLRFKKNKLVKLSENIYKSEALKWTFIDIVELLSKSYPTVIGIIMQSLKSIVKL